MSSAARRPERRSSQPVALTPVDRSDLSEAYGHLPNADGTFNNRRLDELRTGADAERRAWLITLADGFQSYNPGVQRCWTQVATDVAGNAWSTYDDPPVDGRPPDTWITFEA